VLAAAKKSALVRALSTCVDGLQRRSTRRFLQGLATDELQYIAEFLGSCILESGGCCRGSRLQLAQAIKEFERTRRSAFGQAACHCAAGSLQDQDQEHKMILLLEYLCRSGQAQYSLGVGAGQG
jgi:hypothetical protein